MRRASPDRQGAVPPELPITTRGIDIASALDAHQVIIVAGDTGSGTSTQLPKMIDGREIVDDPDPDLRCVDQRARPDAGNLRELELERLEVDLRHAGAVPRELQIDERDLELADRVERDLVA